MNATALKIPTTKDSEQAQVAVRALSGVMRRKSIRTLRVRPEGAKEEVSVSVAPFVTVRRSALSKLFR